MPNSVQYRVTGMDCASCAAKIESAVKSAGIENPKISTATQTLTLDVLSDDERLTAAELAVADAGYHLARIKPGETDGAGDIKLHLTKGYRKALWIVIALNLGYGVIEMIGGAEGLALNVVKNSLSKGKHVITANKALLAYHGTELAQIAEDNDVSLAYEAAVAGGIPIIKALREGFAGNDIQAVFGILKSRKLELNTIRRLKFVQA